MVRRMVILLAVVMAAMIGTVAAATPTPQPLSRQDREFLVHLHQGNLSEIEAGRAVKEKTPDGKDRDAGPAVVDLGEELVTDHMELDAAVRRLAGRLGVELPDQPSAARREQLEKVLPLRGREFDRAWITLGIANHRNGLTLVQRQIKTGTSPEVRDLAIQAGIAIKKHLDGLLQADGTSTPPGTGPATPGG